MNADIHALTGAYACDALDGAEGADFETHLAACESCREEVAELRETAARLGGVAETIPPSSLYAAVAAAVDTTRQLAPVIPLVPARVRRRRLAGRAVIGAAAALVLAVGGLAVHQQQEIQQLRDRATALARVVDAPDTHTTVGSVRAGGTALVLASHTRDAMVFSASHLAVPPSTEGYQLWMIGPDGTRPGPVVRPTRDGAVAPVLARGLGDATTVAMTLEPVRGVAHPTTTPLLVMTLSG